MAASLAWHGALASLLALPLVMAAVAAHRWRSQARVAHREAEHMLREARSALAHAKAAQTYVRMEVEHMERHGLASPQWPEGLIHG